MQYIMINADYPGQARLVCGSGNLEVMRMFLESGADVDATHGANQAPLHAASTNGHLGATQMLLDRGASVNAPDNANQTPLYLASANRQPKAVKLLLSESAAPERGAEANTQTISPVHPYMERRRVDISGL